MFKKIYFLFLIVLFVSSDPIILAASDTWKLYDDSQVAVVEISVDQSAIVWMYNNVESDSMFFATVHFKNAWIDETIDSVGFRLRGNTSRNSQKKSFKLSFNTFVPGRQFYGVDKLNLNGEHNDPSIIRSKLCWDFFGEIGLTASRAAHTAVYINGVYAGLYISVEHIDDEFIQNNFADDSGNLWKCLYPADLTYRGENPQAYFPYFNEERPYELKTNKDEYDFSPLVRLIDIINNTSDNLFADSLEQVLFVPEVLKYFAMNILTGSWDDYWFLMNNYYIYYEPSSKKFHWIPYDYDNSFGIDWFNVDWTSVNPYSFANFEQVQGNEKGPRPLAERIMANPQYRNLYSHFLEFFMEEIYGFSLWDTRLYFLKQLIAPWAETDEFRTLDYGFTMADFHDSYFSENYSNQHVKHGIRGFVKKRISSLKNQITWRDAKPNIYFLDWSPKIPQAGDSIRVKVSAFSFIGLTDVSIHFQKSGSGYGEIYPMFFQPVPSTKIVEESDRWIGTIPPLAAGEFGLFNIIAKDIDGQTQLYPRTYPIKINTAAAPTNVDVVINEFLAKNDETNTDASGEYDDWLELYNPTSGDIFLSGMYLTDNPNNLTKYQFPFGGVAIAANGYLLVWCDNDLNQPGIHTSFKLDADGEFIALVASDGFTIIDSLSFTAQTADISYGRNPDGKNSWQYFSEPTPGYSNSSTGITENQNMPQKFQLFQNYPNPFNAVTTIRFQLPKSAKVNLSVYNIAGQLINTIVEIQKDAGFHSVQWNAKNVNSGVYFFKIETDRFSNVKKCIVIK